MGELAQGTSPSAVSPSPGFEPADIQSCRAPRVASAQARIDSQAGTHDQDSATRCLNKRSKGIFRMRNLVISLLAATVLAVLAPPAQAQAQTPTRQDARLNEGRAAMERGDHATALQLFESACDTGDGRGCTNLGVVYEQGTGGVPRDNTRANALYQRACELGNEAGCRLRRGN